MFLQRIEFQKFWVPEYLLYQCTLLVKIQPNKKSLQSFPLQRKHTWLSSFGNQQRQKLLTFFLEVKIMLIYAKILQLTKMSRLLPNMNMKIFRAVCCHSMKKNCRQNRDDNIGSHTYPTMMKPGAVIPYLKKIQKI